MRNYTLSLNPAFLCRNIIPINVPYLRIQAQTSSSPSPSLSTPPSFSSSSYYRVEFKTLEGCKLGISRYPDFEYSAEGGVGTGKGKLVADHADDDDDNDRNGEILVDFDVGSLYIPPLTAATTKFLGLPLPPFLKIDIVPQIFQGKINKESGKVDLGFKAEFWFSIGTIYRAPPLLVSTVLTSEESQGKMRRGRGQRLDGSGKCTLVGVATVDPIDDQFMNSFLGLPTECLANLKATISLAQSS
ncbi:hypothetical protein Ancab_010132 [Ancistrocladus abbreviatus]